MKYITRPLTAEAKMRLKGVRRESSNFSAPWNATLDLLDRELWHLGVRNEFVMMIDAAESDFKINGELRVNARPASPAVGISFESRKGPLLFVCGKFTDWKDNVRAIALGLEALRKVDRYGITQASEQYKGFGALPPGTPMPAAAMTVEEAALLLLDGDEVAGVGDILSNPMVLDTCFRVMAKKHHPDAGGDPALFRRIVEARDLIAVERERVAS